MVSTSYRFLGSLVTTTTSSCFRLCPRNSPKSLTARSPTWKWSIATRSTSPRKCITMWCESSVSSNPTRVSFTALIGSFWSSTKNSTLCIRWRSFTFCHDLRIWSARTRGTLLCREWMKSITSLKVWCFWRTRYLTATSSTPSFTLCFVTKRAPATTPLASHRFLVRSNRFEAIP